MHLQVSIDVQVKLGKNAGSIVELYKNQQVSSLNAAYATFKQSHGHSPSPSKRAMLKDSLEKKHKFSEKIEKASRQY